MINIPELMTDPDFAQSIVISRVAGGSAFENEGEWTDAPREERVIKAIVQPAKTEDITEFLPEGTRIDGGLQIWSDQALIADNGNGQRFDIVRWRDRAYKIVGIKFWDDCGYWKAFAVLFTP